MSTKHQLAYVNAQTNGGMIAEIITGILALVFGLAMTILFPAVIGGGIAAIVLGLIGWRIAIHNREAGSRRSRGGASVLASLRSRLASRSAPRLRSPVTSCGWRPTATRIERFAVMPPRPVRRLSGLMAISLGCLAVAAQSAAADPTPFATASASCSTGWVTFPVQSAEHQNVIYSVTSIGAQGWDGAEAYYPGDKVWGQYNWGIEAGTAPTFDLGCSSGSVQVSLYDLPNAPASYTAASNDADTTSHMFFNALGSGQYVLNATIDQGAITVNGTTIVSSGQYPLGSLDRGINELNVWRTSGPAAHYTLSVSEVPVQISKLTFGSTNYAAVGSILTGSFSVSGDTSINAYVRNAAGQVVRHLGSFAVQKGDSSVTWDARGDAGAALPDGAYYLHLDSSDPNGNVTSAETPITLDGTPPSAAMISPATISPSQAVTFSLSDGASGVQNASLLIDGQEVADYGEYGGDHVPSTFSYRDDGYDWTLGKHTWQIKSRDNAGNKGQPGGTFSVATPPPPPPPPRCVVPRVQGLTVAGAKHRLAVNHCAVGRLYWTRNRHVHRGRVIATRSWWPGKRLPYASRLGLWVSRGR